jgi:hypothetical protein
MKDRKKIEDAIAAFKRQCKTVEDAKDVRDKLKEHVVSLCPRKLGDIVTADGDEIGRSWLPRRGSQISITQIFLQEESDALNNYKRVWCWHYIGRVMKANGKPGMQKAERIEKVFK